MSRHRGQGHIYRPQYRDRRTGKVKEQSVWWIKYSVNGTCQRESSRSTVKADAVDLLNRRLAERGRGLRPRNYERVLWDDCSGLILTDYAKEGRRSLATIRGHLARLDAAFSGWQMIAIGEDVIDKFAEQLLQELKPATVNNHLGTLLRIFNLAYRARLVERVPAIKKLTCRNTRTGFVRAEELSEIEAELPGYAKPIARIGFITGWRRGELLSRGWRHVDMGAGWLRLEPGETKNEEGRQFPLIPSLRAVLEEQYERKRAVERATGRIVASLFFYDDGRPIREFRFAWNAACRRAGHPGTLFHDLRRSAVRNLVRAGVPQPVAMQLTGHLTASVFRRYAIVDEQMLTEGAAKLSAFLAGARSERKVLPL